MSWFKWVKNWFKASEQGQEKTDAKIEDKLPEGITVAELRKMIAQEYPPFTWEKVGLFLYKDFKKHGLNFTQLKGDEVLPDELVEKINSTLEIFYKRRLAI